MEGQRLLQQHFAALILAELIPGCIRILMVAILLRGEACQLLLLHETIRAAVSAAALDRAALPRSCPFLGCRRLLLWRDCRARAYRPACRPRHTHYSPVFLWMRLASSITRPIVRRSFITGMMTDTSRLPDCCVKGSGTVGGLPAPAGQAGRRGDARTCRYRHAAPCSQKAMRKPSVRGMPNYARRRKVAWQRCSAWR